MRQIRDQKLYLNYAPDWGAFCIEFFQCGKDNVNRLIRNLLEFGPRYYEFAQLMRISAATYRLIAPSIDDEGLHYNGQTIALIPENAVRLAAAVEEIRNSTPKLAQIEAPPPDPLEELERECRDFSTKIERAIPDHQERRWRLKVAVTALRDRLNLLELKI